MVNLFCPYSKRFWTKKAWFIAPKLRFLGYHRLCEQYQNSTSVGIDEYSIRRNAGFHINSIALAGANRYFIITKWTERVEEAIANQAQ